MKTAICRERPQPGLIDQSTHDAGTEPYSVPHLTSTIMHTLLDVGKQRIAQGAPSDVVRIATGSDPIGPLM